jgi:hypothetical protein
MSSGTANIYDANGSHSNTAGRYRHPEHHRKDTRMNTLKLVRSYGRYLLSALAAISFGMDPQ